MSFALQPCGPQPTRLLHPWDYPGKNTGVGCHLLLHNKAEVDVFLEFYCFFNDLMDVGILIFAFLKSSLNMWKFMVHVLLKPDLENFEHYFASVCNECKCAVVWTFFGIAFLWDWNENWPFPVLGPLLSFPNLLAYWVHHFNSIMFFREFFFFF